MSRKATAHPEGRHCSLRCILVVSEEPKRRRCVYSYVTGTSGDSPRGRPEYLKRGGGALEAGGPGVVMAVLCPVALRGRFGPSVSQSDRGSGLLWSIVWLGSHSWRQVEGPGQRFWLPSLPLLPPPPRPSF